MPGIKISALPAASQAELTDVFPIDQLPGPVTKKLSNSQVFDLFKANGEALSSVNDTNVTLTLGGSPSISLLNPVTLTLGWNGVLSPSRGGTGVNNGTNTLTLAGSLSTVGAFSSIFNFTGATNVTFPISGTLATVGEIPVRKTTYVDTTPYSVLTSDEIILVDTATIGAPSSIVLPAAPTQDGQIWTIKDFGYDAQNFPITISVSGGGTIDGNSTYGIGSDNEAASFAWSSSQSEYITVSTYDTLIPVLRISGDTGTASPLIGVITITGGTSGLTTSAAGSTLTLTGTLNPANGGTGVNNGTNTLTLGGNLTTSGAFASTFTMTGLTNVTFPTSGTLATTANTVASAQGTANQVLVNGTSGSPVTGSTVFTLPQSIGTTSSPTFAGLTLTNPYISGAGGYVSTQILTSGTGATYTKPANVKSILVECIGGGGGGGGSGGAAGIACGGPGGAGGYVAHFIANAAATYTYTIGAGGAVGPAGNFAGGTGGTTTFSGGSLSATGGTGGGGMANTTTVSRSNGGVGGVGTGGNLLNLTGNAGGNSTANGGINSSGASGASIFGGSVTTLTTGVGIAGSVYGSGGSGGQSSTTSAAGGAGAGGVIIVTEFA